MDLPEHVVKARQLLFNEGHLMGNFSFLENAQKEAHFDFLLVEKAVESFIELAPRVFADLDPQFEKAPLDFRKRSELVHRIRKRAHTVGANHVLNKMNELRDLVNAKSDAQSLKKSLRAVKSETDRFVSKIEPYIQMLRNIGACDIKSDSKHADPSDKDSEGADHHKKRKINQ